MNENVFFLENAMIYQDFYSPCRSLFLQYTLLDASIILLLHAIMIHITPGLEQP
jgi:hypothetical protein